MKFAVVNSKGDKFKDRDIRTIFGLKKMQEEHPGWQDEGDPKEFIVCFGCKYHPVPTIIIYDDWIE